MGTAIGTFSVSCADPCGETTHVLIEVDYENHPWVWGVAVDQGHGDVIQHLRHPVEKYLEEVDNESTFYLQPKPTYSVSAEATAKAIMEDIAQFLEEADVEGS